MAAHSAVSARAVVALAGASGGSSSRGEFRSGTRVSVRRPSVTSLARLSNTGSKVRCGIYVCY